MQKCFLFVSEYQVATGQLRKSKEVNHKHESHVDVEAGQADLCHSKIMRNFIPLSGIKPFSWAKSRQIGAWSAVKLKYQISARSCVLSDIRFFEIHDAFQLSNRNIFPSFMAFFFYTFSPSIISFFRVIEVEFDCIFHSVIKYRVKPCIQICCFLFSEDQAQNVFLG